MKNETQEKAIAYLNALVRGNTTKDELDLINYIKSCVRGFEGQKKTPKGQIAYIDTLFYKFYSIYARKGSKEQGKKTFRKKMEGLTTENDILMKARHIVQVYRKSVEVWGEEERAKKYIPLISSWLNANIPDEKNK